MEKKRKKEEKAKVKAVKKAEEQEAKVKKRADKTREEGEKKVQARAELLPKENNRKGGKHGRMHDLKFGEAARLLVEYLERTEPEGEVKVRQETSGDYDGDYGADPPENPKQRNKRGAREIWKRKNKKRPRLQGDVQ